ncbi:serine hydrolase [Erythrobacter sp. Alg231-14]|uniref:serine hydrolase n=1 Tax=Erythrobacter sp. Alg231-14 TaxID=1922225 RepID=UPI000D54EEFF
MTLSSNIAPQNIVCKAGLAAVLSGAALIAFSALPAPALAQEASQNEAKEETEQSALEIRAEHVVAIFNGEMDPQDVFTDGFLAQVPPAMLNATIQQWLAQYGAAQSVDNLGPVSDTRTALAIRMERAIARGGMAIDPDDDNRISELIFQSFDPINDTVEKIESDLAALPGTVSAWFGPLDGGTPTVAVNADAQMALGSTFKLYVLAALSREVAQGKRNWDDRVDLSVSSFPSGMMQDWPQGSPVTLHTLASLMISISDNTATDQLIAILGRDAVFQAMVDSGHSAPELNDPFLTTRELFMLKGGPAGRLKTYAQGDAELRLQILEGIEDNPVSIGDIGAAFASGPNTIDVEWFGNAADLTSLFRFMRENGEETAFQIMGINPSMTASTRSQWDYAGYKGGSEPGVLNLTWLVTDNAGQDHALVLSWSNSEASLTNDDLERIAERILNLPR